MNPEDIFEQIISSRVPIKDRDIFLSPDYKRDINNPFLMPDMRIAVDRIKSALRYGHNVCIYGDYDIDGISATALLLEAFSKLGLNVRCYIPNRFDEGYGINKLALKQMREENVDLVVSVDCGSTSHEEIKLANKIGLDVIVTDHHELSDKVPSALAVINPKRKDSQYPFNKLAGVGVAFKLAQALYEEYGIREGLEKWLLDLVALGTICDSVSLVSENRALVYWGLRVMRLGRRPGINALANFSSVEISKVNSNDIAFSLGPRLNAPGRMDSARLSLNLLLSENNKKSEKYAKRISELNEIRRSEQKKAIKEAVKKINKSEDKVIVLFDEKWSEGIIGIIAAKIMEETRKPTFIFSVNGEYAKGSARSFGEFNLSEAIKSKKISLILEKGGGHNYAAGCTIKTTHIEKFKKAINEYYTTLSIDDFKQRNYINPKADIEVDAVQGIGLDLVDLLDSLSPFGQDNPYPIIKINRLNIESLNLLGSKDHCRIMSRDKRGKKAEIICFGYAQKIIKRLKRNSTFSAWVEIDRNTYRGETKLQMKLVHFE